MARSKSTSSRTVSDHEVRDRIQTGKIMVGATRHEGSGIGQILEIKGDLFASYIEHASEIIISTMFNLKSRSDIKNASVARDEKINLTRNL